MADLNHPWATMAIRHWRETRPAMAAALERAGTLERTAAEAADQAATAYARMVENGMDASAATELALAEHVLTPPPPTPDEQRAAEEAGRDNQAAALDLMLRHGRTPPRRTPATS